MGHAIATRLIAAVTAVLIAELTDKVLDRLGLSEDTATLPRALIKATTGALAALIVEALTSSSGDTSR